MIKLKGKRYYLHRFLSVFSKIFNNKTNIIIYAPYLHHSIHIAPMLSLFNKLNEYNLFIVGAFNKKNTKVYDSLDELPIYLHYDLYISTEFLFPPWWLQVKSVFFGHGIGPKLGYQGGNALNNFDYCFSPCKPIFELQSKKNVVVKKIGLPLLDYIPSVSCEEVYRQFGLLGDLPYLVYAPSWNNNFNLISDIKLIIHKLSCLNNYHVIISPHPNLLVKDLCNGIEFFRDCELPLNTSKNNLSTFELCINAKYVISDISSILYEALALNKQVYFDGNDEVYYAAGAQETLNEMKLAIPTIYWRSNIKLQLDSYPQMVHKGSFIDEYLFNRGHASEIFLKTVKEIINYD